MSTIKTFRIPTSRDVILDCAESGDPDGTPVLLLHGFSDSRRAFEPLMAALPDKVRAVAVTHRGHGDSTKPASGYAVADFANDAAAALDALGIERAVVVGHSMGAMIAMKLAIDHPERVLGLVLIGALATLDGNPAAPELIDALAEMRDPVDPEFIRDFQESTLARPVDADFMAQVLWESAKLPAAVWRETLAGMIACDLGPALDRIAAPTLLLWGGEDAFFSLATQETLRDAIPGARLTIVDGGGHAPHWEDPRAAAAEIWSFQYVTARRTAA